MNAPRFRSESRQGHVESWFVRANDPSEPRALWLKMTLLDPQGRGDVVAEAWCMSFEEGACGGGKSTVPLAHARIGERLEVANCRMTPGAHGEADGSVGDRSWSLRWEPGPLALSQPMRLLPADWLVDAPFPRFKFLTPAPVIRVSGELRVGSRRIEVDDWTGMQGHNWGREYSPRYAWGQCVFLDASGEPFCVAEGFSGQIRMAGRVTPLISGLVVRRKDREYRFDLLADLWRQRGRISQDAWTLQIRGRDGEARIDMESRGEQVVCLGYQNPDGRMSYCLNSKLARVRLQVNPSDDDAFECTSPHGGALEFLQEEPDPRYQVI